MTRTLPRGLRNNNPLNIDYHATNAWRGLADPPSDGRFCRFVAMEWGVRAAVVLLRNYRRLYKLDTVRGIVGRWAPKVENNVDAYVASVTKHTGFGADQKLDLADAEVMVRLVRAMARQECGVELDENYARLGVALAP